MIDKDLSIDRSRTSPLKPEVQGNIETGDLLEPENTKNINTGVVLSPEAESDVSTGELIGAEEINDIETGDLLIAGNVSGITTGGLLTPEPLPDTSNFPLNYARIGYDNKLYGGSATADSDNTGAANMLFPDTYSKWRPSGSASNGELFFTDSASICDYIGIAAHNLSGGTLRVTTVTAGMVETIVFDEAITSNKAIYIRFASSAISYIKLFVDGVSGAEIGVVYAGEELEMMRPIYGGHTPINLAADDKVTPQKSDGGQFLGKQIVMQGYKTDANFKHLEGEWYRGKFQPFVEHAKTLPYFWAWNLLEHPDDVVYGWTNEMIAPDLMGIHNWLEVSFRIEGHA